MNVLVTMPFPDELLERMRAVDPSLNVTRAAVAEATYDGVDVFYCNEPPSPEVAPGLRWVHWWAWSPDEHIYARSGCTPREAVRALIARRGTAYERIAGFGHNRGHDEPGRPVTRATAREARGRPGARTARRDPRARRFWALRLPGFPGALGFSGGLGLSCRLGLSGGLGFSSRLGF